MGDTTDASETDADPTPAPQAPRVDMVPDRLPDDHPLVKAYRAEKAKAADARLKLTKYEEAEQTDGEKYAAAVKRAEEAELRAMRLEIAAEKGLTPAQAKRLVGTTIEELAADAEEILEAFPTKPASPPPPSQKPSPSARGGTDPTEPPEPDAKSLVDSIPRL